MKVQTHNRAGLVLIFLGILLMAGQYAGGRLGFLPLFTWRMWALLPLALGAIMMITPFIYRENRGLGGMFIPGAILTLNGLMLTASSLFDWWSLWSWAWPLQFLGLAVGFIMAGWRLRVPDLLIPASIFLTNWLLFQVSALTGWWHLWAYFWPLELAGIAAGLLLTGAIKNSRSMRRGGLVVAQVAAVSLFIMLLFGATAYLALSTGVLLTGTGLILLGWNLVGRGRLPAGLAAETAPLAEPVEKAPLKGEDSP